MGKPASTAASPAVAVAAAASAPAPSLAAPLLQYVDPPNAAVLTARLPAPTRSMQYVRIDRAQIEGKASPFWQAAGAGQIPVRLPDGRAATIVIDDSVMLGADRFTSTGHLAGAAESRVVVAYNQGFLSASIETPGHAYALRPATTDVSQFYEIDPALLPPCGGVRHPVITPQVIAAAAARKARQAELAASGSASNGPATVAADEAPQHPEVHVLMLYTQSVKTTLSGAARVNALQSEFDAAIAKVNTELAASQVTARVKLVKIAETQYDESASASNSVQDDALTALSTTNDGKMDEIQALRDQVGADVVCLALNRADIASIGLSYVLDTPSRVDPSRAEFNPLFAFAVVQYGTIAGTDVVPHELGHVFGCAHARGDPGTTGTKDGAYTYSYGYRYPDQRYHDIMAYAPGVGLSYYSNPNLSPPPENAPLGIAAGQPGEADCALTIEEDAFEVSTYRLQQQQAPTGTLVNVSTRAFVGTGDQVLIGGFVINGTQPKRVLVRAAGPALVPYHVDDALSQVVLHLDAGQTELARNSGWSTAPNASDIATIGGQVGAFPFASGSGDAALLTTLNPGSYTALVEGANGSTGTGLVEVYDVDATGNKVINLSTRGYADIGKDMIGGFVIQGAAGTTKRVLIRVLGPTLSRTFGVTGAMYDPMLELHNANGDLLVKDDDWSTGTTTGTVSDTDDFSPSVTTYSEQQISATGHAPPNRREPCIMVDLPPGNYTVLVHPFENLTSSPPETASPGVAIVEVYEITQ